MAKTKSPPSTQRKRTVRKIGGSRIEVEQRRKDFAHEFVANGGNATQAAIAVGYAAHSASFKGSDLLRNEKVRVIIRELRAKLTAKYQITAEMVIKSLAQAINFDPRKLYRADGTIIPLHELDDDTAAVISSLEVVEKEGLGVDEKGAPRMVPIRTKKVRVLDKNVARDQAMKHLGLYKKDNEQAGAALGRALVTLYLPKNGREKS